MTVHSMAPVLAIVLPLLGATAVYFAGRWRRSLAGASATVLIGATFVLCLWCAVVVLGGREQDLVLVAGTRSFLALRVDGLSALLLALVGLLGLLSVLFSLQSLPAMIRRGHGRPERVPMYYGLLTAFIGTLIWACSTDNIVILWIAVEATTLSSAFLVAFAWDKRATEAGFKYLLLLTVGITFALLGCVLLYSVTAAHRGGQVNPMSISQIATNAGLLAAASPSAVVAATILLLVGFGVKAGLAPLHAWLPDAHSEAPAPISVLLSGIVIKVGAYALIRCVLPFMPHVPGLSPALVGLAAVGMVWGIAACSVQDDLKRLLAYSSFSQIGYVLMGIGLATPLGVFGAIFHLMNHALAKGLLFFAAGSVEHGAGGRSLTRLSGLRANMPVTSMVFFVGALALGGTPGLNGFLSKLTIFMAAARAGSWPALIAAVGTGLLTLVVLVRTAANLFLGRPGQREHMHAREVPALMLAAMLTLAALCAAIGVYPPIADALVGPAAQAAASYLPGGGEAITLVNLP